VAPIRTGRPDLREIDTIAPDFIQEATVPLKDETHSGEDVPVYATGTGAAAFRGSLEQHVLFHLMLQSTPLLRQHLCAAGRYAGRITTCSAPKTLPGRLSRRSSR
jgi:alkaline phosphatase